MIIRLICFFVTAVVAAGATPRARHVVVFVADDLGWSDLGCYGSTFYETPHLDRLAREGARFTASYAASPVCSPTRAALLTGRWPQRSGVTDYIGAPQPEKWTRNTVLLPAPYVEQLPHRETTLAEALKPAGFKTFFAGKWHLGPESHWPEAQGFDINLGGTDAGGPYRGKKYFSPYGNPRLSDGPEGEHLPDRLAREAARFIAANKESPFLIYLPFYDVHAPLMARADLEQKYRAKRDRLKLEDRWGTEGPREVRLSQGHAVYAGMVEAMDQAVGTVLAALDEHGLTDSALVIFTSDNGGVSTSEGWPTTNVPLRAGKGWLYEGGLRVPFLLRWPAAVPSGRVIDVPITSVDLMPTVLAATGLPALTEPTGDGRDLLPLINGSATSEERALFWHYPHYGNQGGAPGAAIRRGDWKLIEWFEDGAVELFDLRRDPGETINLAREELGRVQALHAELRGWEKAVGALRPEPNRAYSPEKPSGRLSNAARVMPAP